MSQTETPQGISGKYKILRELGSGATGTVFLAERVQGFEQTVALKILRWTPITQAAEEPLLGEHVVLRSLDHPNIVALLDHGRMPDGAPFLVLEFLNGETIDIWCDRVRLSIRDRLSLLMQVFSAVIYAHSHLVLHGDIKPANIMILPPSSETGFPTAKLLDFGISRWLEEDQQKSEITSARNDDASSERQHEKDRTGAADIYALGLLMHSLLAGVEARQAGNRLRSSASFRSLDPDRQETIARCRATTPRALTKTLCGPLDAIIDKATAPDRGHRYVSVVTMADDVRRYMCNLETSVYPLGAPQQTLLWARRHAWLTVVTMLMLAVLLTGGSMTLWHHHRVAVQEKETQARLLELAQLTDDLSGKLYRSTESLHGAEQARDALLQAASTARNAVAQENASNAQLALELARQYTEAAELELSRQDHQSRLKAREDVTAAIWLLKSVPRSRDREKLTDKINRLQTLVSISSL